MKDYKKYSETLERENQLLKQQLQIISDEKGRDEMWSQNIIDSIPNPIFIKDKRSRFVLMNAAFCDFVNETKENLLGKTDTDFFSAEQAEVFLRIDSEVLTNGITNWNEEELTIDGVKHDLITSKVRIADSKHNNYILGLITDITDNKDQQVLLKKQKEELETEKKNVQTLLKEVHHRVKNNLQIISSLLNLQMRSFEEEKVKEAFINCRSRIMAMAKVHEVLYKTENFTNINFATYIASLIDNLKLSFKVEDTMEFDLQLSNVFLNVDTAIPLGMVVNEIVTNSIKHASSEEGPLMIYLDMNTHNDHCELNIGDNGKGDELINATEPPSLGMELIELFCKQVEAKLQRLDKKPGVHYQVVFTNKRN